MALGILAAACVLWWAFARSEDVAGVVFMIRRGQPIYEVDFVFKRVLAVWMGGLVLAGALVASAIALRRAPISPGAPGAWRFFAAELAVLPLLFLTVVGILGRPLLSPTNAAALAVFLLVAILDRRRARPRAS